MLTKGLLLTIVNEKTNNIKNADSKTASFIKMIILLNDRFIFVFCRRFYHKTIVLKKIKTLSSLLSITAIETESARYSRLINRAWGSWPLSLLIPPMCTARYTKCDCRL